MLILSPESSHILSVLPLYKSAEMCQPTPYCMQISWVRHRDIHLLTVGRYTYTSDQRFSAHHIPLTHFWQLRIRAVTPRDEGFYECQVSTTPPRGHRIELRVVGERIQKQYFDLEPERTRLSIRTEPHTEVRIFAGANCG